MKLSKHPITLLLILSSMFLLPYFSFSQLNIYKFEQVENLQKIEKRTVAVFIHTDWCKYCQLMQNKTFKHDSIINKLNNYFYFIDLNAEEIRDISFNKKILKYKPTGTNTGIHELAEQLANINNKVVYPTLCFLNDKNEIIFQYIQFINAKDLQIILTRLK